MNEEEVVALMKSSISAREWEDNADKVKAACGGYPQFWYAAIVESGVLYETFSKWETP